MSTTAITADQHGHGDPTLQHHFSTKEQQFDTSKLGMWLFLTTEILLFGGLFVGYGIMQGKYPEAWVAAHHHLQRSLGALNTVVLLVSSFTMVMGVWAAQHSKRKALIWFLILTLTCAAVFLGVKYFEYSHKYHDGLLPGKYFDVKEHPNPPHQNIFFSFYFMMTGLHGLHILGGMVALTCLLIGAIRGRYDANYYTPVDLVGLYWHLVDLIWIYLFPLLYLIQ
jgi:cytochrome c oxidase subunit III